MTLLNEGMRGANARINFRTNQLAKLNLLLQQFRAHIVLSSFLGPEIFKPVFEKAKKYSVYHWVRVDSWAKSSVGFQT